MAQRRSAGPKPTRARMGRGLALAGGLGLFLLALVGLGTFTREQIQDWDRYTLAFTAIDCTPPPGQDRGEFLTEVRQRAGLPERLRLLEDGLAARLAEAFARHPWVETVERVAVLPRQVQVRLVYRVPALEVMLVEPVKRDPAGVEGSKAPTAEAGGACDWVVDGRGVLLSRAASQGRLPLLLVTARPVASEGQPWGEAAVEAAAHTAAYLRPQQTSLGLWVFETSDIGLVLCTAAGSRVLWGEAPGAELAGEAPAARKLEWLLDYCRTNGSLDQPGGRQEHDVRPREGPLHRPLPRPD